MLSPQNERELARSLEAEIRRVWPDPVTDPDDRIDLLVGARSGVDVDFLVAIDLATPRRLPAVRSGTALQAPQIACGLIAIEVKQLDATRFERIGDQLFASYRGEREHRSGRIKRATQPMASKRSPRRAASRTSTCTLSHG